jgi:hypothetical protein
MSKCRCKDVGHLHGVAAQEYAQSHLEVLEVDDVNWTVLYRCPSTGILWKETFPHSGAHGGGPSELQRLADTEAEGDE